MKSLKLKHVLAVVFFGALTCAGATERPGAFLSKDEILRGLQRQDSPGEQGVRSRSLGSRNLVVRERSVDLTINFEFDSDRVVASSLPQLEQLKDALQDPKLARERFLVEGHTDAKGTAEYNQALSERRALAIARFLQGAGVSKERLDWRGKGFSELKDPDQPQSAVNRRVRVKAID